MLDYFKSQAFYGEMTWINSKKEITWRERPLPTQIIVVHAVAA
jgi:hypothetical protein